MDECKTLVMGCTVCRVQPHLRLPGRAVQVDPIKSMLTVPVIKLLRPKFDIPRSSFAFNFNLRRYKQYNSYLDTAATLNVYLLIIYTGFNSLTNMAGRCRLTLSRTRVDSAYGINA